MKSYSSYKLPQVCCMYIVKCESTGESYVGSTCNLNARWGAHRSQGSTANELMSRPTSYITWTETGTKEEALALEQTAILTLPNLINIQRVHLNDDERKASALISDRVYREANKEAYLAQRRRYKEANRESINAKRRKNK